MPKPRILVTEALTPPPALASATVVGHDYRLRQKLIMSVSLRPIHSSYRSNKCKGDNRFLPTR
jgi:hypothetical protein